MQIDLEPHEYRSEPRPNEPIFGAGWPFGVAALVTILVATLFHGQGVVMHGIGAIIGAAIVGIFYQFL